MTDTGKGIEEKDLKYIFDLYYTNKEKDERGFGLYFVKDLIIKLGWEIDVKSAPGRGTTFILIQGN